MAELHDSHEPGEASEAALYEYQIRMLNNELFELVNTTELSIKTIEQIDTLLAMKARLILDGFSDTFPEIAAAVRQMLLALRSSTTTDDQQKTVLDELHGVLRELLQAKHDTSEDDEDRQRELDRMIELIEYILAAHVTSGRTDTTRA